MEHLQSMNGQNNEFIIILSQGRIDSLASGNGKLSEIVSRANISIIGNIKSSKPSISEIRPAFVKELEIL